MKEKGLENFDVATNPSELSLEKKRSFSRLSL